ncbi:competence type IV pilus minor pilin ComGF [Oceanobacillus timonensis]|uniref:competence type IV pilus minor pilin ComGF n=1 Tax=Oceanobacillus timonensis TaxID=1926285 RepID=UPI0009BA1589|nr:competence type IV pilus minor pilin ComGF [Oceanobacillus timonensis]
MPNKKQKQNVSMPYWNNQKGFTLISMLVALTVLTLTLPFVHYALSTLSLKQTYTEALSMQQFFIHLHDDIIASTSIHVADNQLHIRFLDRNDNTEKTATFSQYNHSIRRQVNRQGHEIYLHDVSDVAFEEQTNAIFLTITKESGEVYEKTIYNAP